MWRIFLKIVFSGSIDIKPPFLDYFLINFFKAPKDEHKIKLSELTEKEITTVETTSRLGTIVVANGTFAALDEAKELPAESAKRLSARYYTLEDFASNDEPSTVWTCRAKLDNGSLCQRQDKIKVFF